MKKKLLSLILAVSLVLSSFTVLTASINVNAATTPSKGDTTTFENPNGIELNKTLTNNGNGSYTINLESYTTGTVSTDTETKPTDIVLVLDISGSMTDYDINSREFNLSELDPKYQQNYVLRRGVNSYHMQYYNGKWQYWYGQQNYWIDIDTIQDEYHIYARYSYYLEIAVEQFIDTALTISSDNKIGIIAFNNHGYNISKGLINNAVTLKGYVNSLNFGGGTSPHEGLELAEGILSPIKTAERNQAVIMFTDGNPNTDLSARYTIESAGRMKTDDVKMYTVGTFPGANPNDLNNETNKLMNFVSSNYPQATSIDNGGSGSNQGYYLKSDSSSGLDAVFDQIATTITSPTSDINIDGTAITSDTLSDYFKFPENFTNVNVTAKKVKCTGVTNGVYSWEENGTDDPDISVTFNQETKTVSVTGFNYDANVVTEDEKEDGSHGSKLVYSFDVQLIDNFIGGNNVPSNKESSGIYVTSQDEPVAKYPQPKDNIELKHDLQVESKTIYLGNGVEYQNLLKLDNGIIDGTNNDFVNIDYEIYDITNLDTPIKTVSIPAGTDAKTIEDINLELMPQDCTNYIVKYSVNPSTLSQNNNVDPIENQERPFEIHVLKPTFEVQNLWADCGANADLSLATKTEPNYITNCGHENAPVVSGDIPKLTLKYKEGENDISSPLTVTENKTITAEIVINQNPSNIKNTFDITLNRFDLKITKTVNTAEWAEKGQNLIVNVTQNNATTKVVFTKEELEESGKAIKTITGLYAGVEVTVQEDENWSWRSSPIYSKDGLTLNSGTFTFSNNPAVTITDPGNKLVNFGIKNNIEDKKWISISEIARNIFGQRGDN